MLKIFSGLPLLRSFILTVFSIALFFPHVRTALQTNNISLQYRRHVQAATISQPFFDIPASHPRAVYWQAAQTTIRGDWETTIVLIKPLADSGDMLALELAGNAYEALGDYSSAYQAWVQVGDTHQLMKISGEAQRTGNMELAIQAYFAAWDINPRITTSNLARLLIENGNLEQAEQVYRHSILMLGSDSRQPDWHLRLAQLLMKQERWGEAVQAWEGVLSTVHRNPVLEKQIDRLYFEMAWAYHKDKQDDKAIETIQKAIAIHPRAGYFLRAGQIYEAIGETENALLAYQQVLQIQSNHQIAQEAIKRLESEK